MDVSKENARTIVQSFNYITCDAFSPAEKDFAAGLNFLKQLESESNFDYISCNINDSSQELIFKPYKIMNYGDFSVGVIGASSVFDNPDLYVEDPFSSIRKASSEIRDRCDLIVLLFSASDLDYKKIITSANTLGVDFIVRGDTRRKSTDGGAGAIPTYSTGDRGKVIYQFDFKYRDKSSSLIDIAFYEKQISSNQKRLSRLENNADNSVKISQYEEKIQINNSIIEKAQNTLQFKSVTLNKMISDDPYILKIVDASKAKILDMGGPSILDPHHGHNH